MDLDGIPNPNLSATRESDLRIDTYLGDWIYSQGNARISSWNNPDMPSPQQCSEHVITNSLKSVKVNRKSTICLWTDEGRIVRVKILELDTPRFNHAMAMMDIAIWDRL
ncbi:hypothetical protein [Nonomuraea fuscirosea]|uniref:hypothetical protein n=1 Tax=Nonomuraea fuscirosea TaxID=1291556 RepID=UPI0033C1AF10